MSESDSLLNKTWTKLLDAMVQLFERGSMTRNAYGELYGDIVKYLDSPEREKTLLKAKPKEQSDKNDDQADKKEVDTNIPGGELYFMLKACLKELLEKKIAKDGKNLENKPFLEFYAKTWDRYQSLSQIINRLFTAMNNNWVSRHREDGVTDFYTMAMRIWQDVFFKDANQSLIRTCLKLIRDERDGQKVDSLLIRQVVQSYVSAGFTEDERNNRNNRPASLATYNDYFEKQFLEETELFYRHESDNYLKDNSVSAYLIKVTQRLKEEEDRARAILHPTTLQKLMPKIEEILIKKKLELIYTESEGLINAGNIEGLRIIFDLVNRIDKANEPIQKYFEEYVHRVGMDEINCISATANNDPKIYVETIIQVYMRFFQIVKEGFRSEHGYMAALDKACGKFINNNAVTTAAGGTKKSSELLARYCDKLLRKGNRGDESDVEEKITEIMVVFNYVEDKDVFQKFYGKLLAKRLVGQLSASDDYEESMISKLKQVCGFEYTSKLERMFKDIGGSKNLIDQYQRYCEKSRLDDIVDFSVMVLTSHSWPFSAPPIFALSPELKPTLDSFTNFYTGQHNGRILTWLHQHSKGDLQTLYTKQKYILHVSTYQMVVLLSFNKLPSWTVERLRDETQIETDLFLQVLCGLLKSKLIICSEINEDELEEDLKETDVKMNYTVQLFNDFKSKNIRINLNVPLKSVEQKEIEGLHQKIDEDREMVIQAAIVRIMKARQTLKHALLMQEVIQQLSSRFKPKIPVIKKCIDKLIEKEYLERKANEKDVLHYVA